MKKAALSLCMLTMFNVGYAQQVIEVQDAEKSSIVQNLENESENKEHDKKTRRQLKKVAEAFKNSSQKIQLEVKSLDDCDNCEGKTKGQVVVRNVGRKLGKASAWLSTTTGKPFMIAAGFVTGLFEKKDKNQDIVALYKFFLNHSKEFDQIYVEAGTPEEMVELMLSKMEEIMEQKSRVILKDFLLHIGVKREIPADLAEFELTEEDIEKIDMEKVKPDFINNHPEYLEVKPIIGEVTQAELEDIIYSGYFDKSITFENYKAALPKIHEAGLMIVGQIFAPKLVLGIISKSLVGIYTVPVVLADIGTGVSAAICMQKETQEKFENDKDLKSFCSYVVNRSAYTLMKSRAKGYVAGKNSRAKIEEKIQQRKERRAKRKAERNRA